MIGLYREQNPAAPLSHLCAALGINRSWFYACPAETKPDEEAVALRDHIEEIVLEWPRYGYRRVTALLHREGRKVNDKRVLRVMREESLLCRLKKRFVVTTDSSHSHLTYPNLLKSAQITQSNQAWQADVTYIRLPGGFCYLAALLDSYSRRCVGWHLFPRHRHEVDAGCAGEGAV